MRLRAGHDPDHRSLRKAGRTGLVMSACFLFGVYVLHNSQFAVIAAFTSAALLGIADFSGSRIQRLEVTAATLVAGAALLALGTAVSTNTIAAATTMFAVTFLVAFSAVFSGYFTAASSAVIVFYVVATGVEGPVSVIPAREAGLAVGGALSLVAIGWLWPSNQAAATRRSLGRVYELLADRIGGLLDGSSASPVPGQTDLGSSSPTTAELAKAIIDAERAIAASAWRPDGLSSPHKARMYLLQGARRLSGLVDLYGSLPATVPADLLEATDQLTESISAELRRCARRLESRSSDLPDAHRIEVARDRFTAAAQRHFAEVVASPHDPAQLATFADWVFVLQQLGWGAILASIHCRVVHGAPLDVRSTVARSPLVVCLADRQSARKWLRRARRNLTFRSIHMQNSLRLAAGLGLARLVVGAVGLQHGFWVGFATLVVLKTSSAGTRSTAAQAAVGTALGFGISTLFIATYGVHAAVYSIILPIVVFAAFYLPTAVSFVAGQACFTIVIVVLFNLLKPAGWTVGLIRLEDVGVGAVIGLVIGMAIWPRGASSELSRVVAELYIEGSTYARATVENLVEELSPKLAEHRVDPSGLRRRVEIASLDAEDVFSQYLAEPHQSDAPVIAWSSLIASAHQLWYGTLVVGLLPVPAGSATRMPELCRGLLSSAARLDRVHRALAAALVSGGEVEVEMPERVVGPVDPEFPRTAMTLLELEAWMAELTLEVERVGPALRQLKGGDAAPTRVSREVTELRAESSATLDQA